MDKKKKKQKRLNSTYIWHYGLTICLNKNLNLIFFMYFNRFHIYAGIKNKLKNIILI